MYEHGRLILPVSLDHDSMSDSRSVAVSLYITLSLRKTTMFYLHTYAVRCWPWKCSNDKYRITCRDS